MESILAIVGVAVAVELAGSSAGVAAVAVWVAVAVGGTLVVAAGVGCALGVATGKALLVVVGVGALGAGVVAWHAFSSSDVNVIPPSPALARIKLRRFMAYLPSVIQAVHQSYHVLSAA